MSGRCESAKTAAIVLGGGLKKVADGDDTWYEPEEQAKARLDRAYALFIAGEADVIISTGKYGPMTEIDPKVTGAQTEAEVGAKYLIAKALSEGAQDVHRRIEDCILIEDQSQDTIGNAWFSKKLWLEPQGITSCIVVTSDYHIERSRLIFEWVLGPRYTVRCAGAPSPLTGEERAHRDQFERGLTALMQQHLMSGIAAGDDEALRHFIENEHRALLAGGGPPPDGFIPPAAQPA